jgi:predicted O-methyltransferase YrrM
MKKRRFEVLADMVKKNGWTRGAEIGLFKGATFFHLLDHCPDLTLIGVDSWASSEQPHAKDINAGLSTWHSPEEMEVLSDRVITKAQAYQQATVYHCTSLEAAGKVEDGSLDFVFVDADHSTEGVLSDVRAWAPKVRQGGWIVGHDEQWPSVRRALQELFPKWTVHGDNVWSAP